MKRNCRNFTRKKPPFKEEEAAAVSFVVREGDVEKFIVDSGATSHMCSQRKWFEDLKPSSGTACAAKSRLLEVAGIGVIRGRLKNGQEIVLKNVLFIQELNGNLISVKQIQKVGYSVLFKDNKAIVKGKNETFVLCELNSNGQYDSDFIPTVSNTFVAETEEAELWHRRLGHSGNHALRKLGLTTSDSFCKNCALAKQSAEPIGNGNRRRESAPMRMIHSDLCGPLQPAALSGERYVLTFVDDYSRFCEVRLVKKKSDIAVEFNKFLKVNDTVKRIRCDNAKEIPCTNINDCTPYELKYSTEPDLSKIRIFGCDVYVKVADTQRRKLDPKSKKMIFIGYSSMGYRVMDPVTRRVTVSRNVHFVEKKIISDKLSATPNIENQEDTSDLGEENEKEMDIKIEETERAIDDKYPEFRRSQRERKSPVRYPFNEALSATNGELTFDEIKFLPDEEQSNSKSAMNEEMLSMEKNKVWDLVELPEKEKQTITCKWIFKRKRDGKY
ncbi:Copia protein [Araneus ventricosus]|uniref:Copia protein n=1 Tax=Araneus ventricosus TaxID=182803 RepID=A0A4Y2MRD0_ARAVE|nr:Copia protein [Araneus ventricosus]